MSDLDTFIETCSEGVHPDTVAEIVQYAGPPDLHLVRILTPGGSVLTAAFESGSDAVAKSIKELEKGAAVSIGVMQVSSDHWLEFDVNVFDMAEPCTSIYVGTSILAKEYIAASRRTGNKYAAMEQAVVKYLEENIYIDGKQYSDETFRDRKYSAQMASEKEHWKTEMVVTGFAEKTQIHLGAVKKGEGNDL